MGQDESTLSPEGTLVKRSSGDDEPTGGSPEVSPTKKVMCDNCDSPATYRCKMKVGDLTKVRDYSYLMDYWVPQTRIVRGEYIVAYVGCDKCISESVKSVFTHKPEGWYEAVCMEDDYEEAQLY